MARTKASVRGFLEAARVVVAGYGQPMGRAEFAEKEYEIAMAIELSAGATTGSRVYPCSQILEEILGYDVSADPRRQHPIWQVLAAPRPPGIKLIPEYWSPGPRPPAEQLPPSPVSLILQYKRPDYLRGHRAKQWRMWKHPYYRFEITPHQQRVLKRVEGATKGEAVVRYACPAIWKRGDFERARYTAVLVEESGYVSPSALAGHRVWTFDSPGADGRANPAGRQQPFETFADLVGSISGVAPERSHEIVATGGLPRQVLGLGSAARQREPRLRSIVDPWIASLEILDLGLTSRQLDLLSGYASVVTILSAIGATWHLVDREATEPR